jgi:hypothetical protein
VTTTLMFRLDDIRLREEEKRKLLPSSNDLARRTHDRPRKTAPDPRAQQAQHFKIDRGDL